MTLLYTMCTNYSRNEPETREPGVGRHTRKIHLTDSTDLGRVVCLKHRPGGHMASLDSYIRN
eukprot:4783664-Prymnesium_polylepis.1